MSIHRVLWTGPPKTFEPNAIFFFWNSYGFIDFFPCFIHCLFAVIFIQFLYKWYKTKWTAAHGRMVRLHMARAGPKTPVKPNHRGRENWSPNIIATMRMRKIYGIQSRFFGMAHTRGGYKRTYIYVERYRCLYTYLTYLPISSYYIVTNVRCGYLSFATAKEIMYDIEVNPYAIRYV